MRRTRDRKPASIDIDHLRLLHEEAMDQLELMRTAFEAAEQATGASRDKLEDMASNHWHAYLDVLHMISMHDQLMSAALKESGMEMRLADKEFADRQLGPTRLLLLLLLAALIRHHRRMWYVLGLRGNPMADYLKDSMTTEREHIAQLVAMTESML